VAVPALFVFWKRTTLSATLTAAIVGFVSTIGAFWFEYHYLQTADANAPHYYTHVLPAWLVNSQGYNYVATGVILSLVSIVVVSLITGPATARQLAALKPQPVEEYDRFTAAAAQYAPAPAAEPEKTA
jgi:Na+/proline symporter